MDPSTHKQTLRDLPAKCKNDIERTSKSIMLNNKVLHAIRELIDAEPRTVPQIAQTLAMDTAEVLIFVSAMKKFGEVVEGDRDGGYFRYGLISQL